MKNRIPVYAEAQPHAAFMRYIRNWLRERKLKPEHLLVSRPYLVIAVLNNSTGRSIICFYVQRLCSLGNGGVVVYYDVEALSTRLKMSVENTFTNWLATIHVL